jgi:type IV pilus assembly protein PilB
MRILDESNQAVTLEQLGYWGYAFETISDAITEPHGMILVTGPTGSGKSTSLFSILTQLNQPDVNISTIEDPVEYKIPGVNQTQTNTQAGMTFASGLRALLRQDPNIIMVGEIRDGETANLGVQAALTGHLVFSTLHTNNAATCLPRLLDMDIEPFLIASTVRAVIGQRLVRRLERTTRVAYNPSDEEKDAILHLFNLRQGQDFRYIHELEKQAAAQGVGGDAPLSTDENGIKTLYRPGESEDESGKQDGF